MKTIPVSQAYNKVAPENVVLVLAYDQKLQRPTGMVCTWNCFCSIKPARFAVSLWKKGYTHKVIQQSKEFTVAYPGKKLIKAMEVFSSCHGNKVDKFGKTGIKTLPAKFVKPPLLSDAVLNLECKLIKSVDVGDHFLFIGEVAAAHYHPGQKMVLHSWQGTKEYQEY